MCLLGGSDEVVDVVGSIQISISLITKCKITHSHNNVCIKFAIILTCHITRRHSTAISDSQDDSVVSTHL